MMTAATIDRQKQPPMPPATTAKPGPRLNIHKDGSRPILVFGSNLRGVHGAGAARLAYDRYGAVTGDGIGLSGSSYALPTKAAAAANKSLTLEQIEGHVRDFRKFAENSPNLHFHITRIGCGLAGYSDYQIAPMFKPPLPNCSYPEEWRKYLEE